MLGEFVRRHARQQRAADAQVDFGTGRLGNQGISRLLDPVVHEFVGVILTKDEPSEDGFPQCRVHRLLPVPVNQRQGGDPGDVAQAGELFQGFLGGHGQPLQPRDHEIRHVVGIALGANSIDVPLPGPRDWIEREQPLVGQRGEKLDREERIAAGLLLHQLRQRQRLLRLAMQGSGEEPADIVEPEGRQHDFLDPRSGSADRLERAQQRVRGADLVVPVGPDHQQMPDLRVRHQLLEEVERCRIEPLQIVEKQCERVLLAREYAQEAPEHQLEAVLRLLRRQYRDGRLCSDHELQLGNEVHDELTVAAQCVAQGLPPPAQLLLALAQKRAQEALEGLSQGGIRDVALVLVELAGSEEATRRDEHLVQLVHHGGLADPGIAGHEHELRRAMGHDPVEGREQRADLALPPVQPLRDHEPVRYVVRAHRERVDAAMRRPFRQAPAEIGFDARGGLVSVLGGLGQQLHHDRRYRSGNRGALARRRRLPGNVAMDPPHRIGGGEGQRPREHLVESDAERI